MGKLDVFQCDWCHEKGEPAGAGRRTDGWFILMFDASRMVLAIRPFLIYQVAEGEQLACGKSCLHSFVELLSDQMSAYREQARMTGQKMIGEGE